MIDTRKNDLRILTALYDGNHLKDDEKKRLINLLDLLNLELVQVRK